MMFLNYNVLFQSQIIPRKIPRNLSSIHIIKKNFPITYLVIFFDNHEANWPKNVLYVLIFIHQNFEPFQRSVKEIIATSNMTSEPSFFFLSFIKKLPPAWIWEG